MSRALKWVGIMLGGLVVLVAVTLAVFDWNWLKSELTGRASAAAGRDIAIDGDIDVDLSLTPLVRMTGVRVENADWGSEPTMLTIDELQFRVELLELLRGRVVLPELQFIRPKLLLEKNAEGVPNWEFGAGSEAEAAKEAAVPEERGEFPIIGRLVIDDGTVDYRDPAAGIVIASKVDTATGTGGDERVTLTGEGEYEGKPFTVEIVAGSLLMLREEDDPYPIQVKAAVGETRWSVQGTLMDPVKLAGLDLTLEISGPSLAELFSIFGIPLPESRTYTLAGRLGYEGTRWSFSNFAGKVGESDLSGSLTIETAGERPFMTAELVSERLDIRELAGLIGAEPEEEKPDDRLLPDQEIALERLRAMDMQVAFTAKRIDAPDLPIESMTSQLRLENGRAVLEPVEFGVAGGTVGGTIMLNGREEVPSASADVTLTRLGLERFFAGSEWAREMGGTFGGRVDLSGRGRNFAELLGAGDGEVAIVMGGGKISPMMIELIGLDAGEALLLLADDRAAPVPVRCAVGDFAVQDGLMTVKALVLDTADSAITGEGAINLKTERLDLTLLAHPKDASLLSARAPVHIEGRFLDPQISIDTEALAARGVAAVALGVLLTPLAGLIPLIEPGTGADAPCRSLIEQARKSGG